MLELVDYLGDNMFERVVKVLQRALARSANKRFASE
jgi:hypothetical protein